MKQITFLFTIFILISAFGFTSCKEDKYLDWKFMNELGYEKYNKLTEEEGSEWKKTNSGLIYRVIYGGDGVDRPSSRSGVVVTYTGKFITGTDFDSASRATGYVSDFAKGFSEGLKMMKLNAIYEICIPYQLGYGEDGTSSNTIPPYTTMIFRLQLHHFETIHKEEK